MKIRIEKAEEGSWYYDHIGAEFDAKLRKHPTFLYLEYILENTEHNQSILKDSLTRSFLRDGLMGVRFKNACSCHNRNFHQCGVHLT